MKLFLVAVQEDFNRDVQIAMNKEADFMSNDWVDGKGDLIIATLWAYSPESAIEMVALSDGLDHETLTSYELNQKPEEDQGLVSTILWYKDDLAEVFRKYNVLCTEENFDRFIHSKMSTVLKDRSVEEGWEILDIIVSDSLDEFECFDEKELDHFLDQGEWISAPDRESEDECYLWEDFKEAEAFYKENKNELYIYTVLDCEGLWISEGYHVVNRYSYMFSKVKIEMVKDILYRP